MYAHVGGRAAHVNTGAQAYVCVCVCLHGAKGWWCLVFPSIALQSSFWDRVPELPDLLDWRGLTGPCSPVLGLQLCTTTPGLDARDPNSGSQLNFLPEPSFQLPIFNYSLPQGYFFAQMEIFNIYILNIYILKPVKYTVDWDHYSLFQNYSRV